MEDVHRNNNYLQPLIISGHNKDIWSHLALGARSLVNVGYFHDLVWLYFLVIVLVMKHIIERWPAAH
jgi:hypothetical protein